MEEKRKREVGLAARARPASILAEHPARRNAALDPRVVAIVLVALVASGFFLRWRDLVARPLWLDESSFWKASVRPVGEQIAWRHHFEHPPLAYMLEGRILAVTGERPEWKVRLPSLLWGLLCIPGAFLLGSVVGGPTLGLLTAALAAFDPLMVEQSRQARMYTLFELLLLVSLAATIVLVRRGAAPRWQWVGLGALQAAMGWTSLAALAAWAGEALGIAWLLRSLGRDPGYPARDARRGLRWTAATTLVLWSPGIYRVGYRLVHPILDPRDADPAARVARDLGVSVLGAFGNAWGALLIPIMILGLVRLCRREPVSGRLLAAIAALNLIGLLALRAVHPMIQSRYLVAALPAIWMGSAAFVTLAAPPWRRLAFAVFALAAAGTIAGDLLAPRPRTFRVGGAVRDLAPVVARGDAVVFLPRFLDTTGEYYGVPPSPPLARGERHPAVEALDGRRVWVILGGLGSGRRRDEASSFLDALAHRRGAGRGDRERLPQGFAGAIVFDPDGREVVLPPEEMRPALEALSGQRE